MQFGIISEVMSDGRVCMLPSAFAGIRNLVLANIDGRHTSEFGGKKQTGTYQLRFDAECSRMVQDYVGDTDFIKYCVNLKPEDRVVNMVCLTGPMTRNGAECSIGTKGLRDKIMKAADIPQCKGHIIYCDTPGGMASSIQDLRMAIDYAHAKGQSVYMLIDGMCASGGAFASALCDKVFFVNPEDEIGSIGMYSAFFTLEDGAKNTITSEVYHEVYASKSENKNQWYREAASGNMNLVEEGVNKDLAELIEKMKADRPSILEEQMTGMMYKMKDVIGTLVDEQGDIASVATALLADFDARGGAPITNAGEEKPEDDPNNEPEPEPQEPEENPDENPDDDEEGKCNPKKDGKCNPDEEGKCNPDEDTNSFDNMKQFTAIPAAIGEEAMESADGTLFLQESQADALEALLQAGQTKEAELQQQLEALNAQMSEQQTTAAEQLAAQVEQNEQLQQQLATLQTELENARNAATEAETAHTTAIAESDAAHTAAIETLQTELNEAREAAATAEAAHAEALEKVNNELANAMQQITDLNATVEELNSAAGQQPAAGEAPQTAGQQAPTIHVVTTRSTFDRNLSAKENAARWRNAQGKK